MTVRWNYGLSNSGDVKYTCKLPGYFRMVNPKHIGF